MDDKTLERGVEVGGGVGRQESGIPWGSEINGAVEPGIRPRQMS